MVDKDTVLDWLVRRGLSATADEDAETDAYWHLRVRYPKPDGPQVSVFVPTADGDDMRVQMVTAVSDVHRDAIKGLTPEAFREFRFQLLRDLLRSRAQYSMEWDTETQDFERFAVLRRIWPGSIDRTQLFEAVQDVFDINLLIIVHVRHAAGGLA